MRCRSRLREKVPPGLPGGRPETGTGPNLSALPCASQHGASWSCAFLQYWFSPRCSPVVPAAVALKTLFPRGQMRRRPAPRASMQRVAVSQKTGALLRRSRKRRRKHNQRRGHLRQRQNNRRRSPIVRTRLKSRPAGGAPSASATASFLPEALSCTSCLRAAGKASAPTP